MLFSESTMPPSVRHLTVIVAVLTTSHHLILPDVTISAEIKDFWNVEVITLISV